MRFEVALASNTVSELRPESLPQWAVGWLGEGMESTSLAVLAGSRPDEDPRVLRELFVAVAKEMGNPLPTREEAAEILKIYYAEEVAADRLDPERGAFHIIYDAYLAVHDPQYQGEIFGEDFGIARLAGAYYSLEDARTDSERAEDLDTIASECREIVAKGHRGRGQWAHGS